MSERSPRVIIPGQEATPANKGVMTPTSLAAFHQRRLSAPSTSGASSPYSPKLDFGSSLGIFKLKGVDIDRMELQLDGESPATGRTSINIPLGDDGDFSLDHVVECVRRASTPRLVSSAKPERTGVELLSLGPAPSIPNKDELELKWRHTLEQALQEATVNYDRLGDVVMDESPLPRQSEEAAIEKQGGMSGVPRDRSTTSMKSHEKGRNPFDDTEKIFSDESWKYDSGVTAASRSNAPPFGSEAASSQRKETSHASPSSATFRSAARFIEELTFTEGLTPPDGKMGWSESTASVKRPMKTPAVFGQKTHAMQPPYTPGGMLDEDMRANPEMNIPPATAFKRGEQDLSSSTDGKKLLRVQICNSSPSKYSPPPHYSEFDLANSARPDFHSMSESSPANDFFGQTTKEPNMMWTRRYRVTGETPTTVRPVDVPETPIRYEEGMAEVDSPSLAKLRRKWYGDARPPRPSMVNTGTTPGQGPKRSSACSDAAVNTTGSLLPVVFASQATPASQRDTSGEVTVEPTSMDFGVCVEGSSTSQTLLVRNGTNANVRLDTALVGTGAEYFRLEQADALRGNGSNAPGTIAAGACVAFHVCYQPPHMPTGEEWRSASVVLHVVVSGEDESHSDWKVNIRGISVNSAVVSTEPPVSILSGHSDTNGPVQLVGTGVLDFGLCAAHRSRVDAIELRNTSDNETRCELDVLSTSNDVCPFTCVRRVTIPPHSSARVSVSFSPKFPGTQGCTVRVTSGTQVLHILMQGQCETARWVVTPSSQVVSFGCVGHRKTSTRQLTIENRGRLDVRLRVSLDKVNPASTPAWSLRAAEAEVEKIQSSSIESRNCVMLEIPAGEKKSVAVDITPVDYREQDGRPRRYGAVILIHEDEVSKSTDDTKIQVDATVGTVKLRIPRGNETIAFSCSSGDSSVRPIPIKNAGSIPVEVVGEVDCESFSIGGGDGPMVLEPGQVRELIVTFQPTSVGQTVGRLRLTCNNSPQYSYHLWLRGTAETSALLLTDRPSVDFGFVPVGEKVSQPVSIRNNSPSSCTFRVYVAPTSRKEVSPFRAIGHPSGVMSLKGYEEVSVSVQYHSLAHSFASSYLYLEPIHSKSRYRVKMLGSGGSSSLALQSGDRLVDFGSCRPGVPKKVSFTVCNHGDRVGYAVVRPIESSLQIRVEPAALILSPGEYREIELHICPLGKKSIEEQGFYHEKLRVEILTGNEEMRQGWRRSRGTRKAYSKDLPIELGATIDGEMLCPPGPHGREPLSGSGEESMIRDMRVLGMDITARVDCHPNLDIRAFEQQETAHVDQTIEPTPVLAGSDESVLEVKPKFIRLRAGDGVAEESQANITFVNHSTVPLSFDLSWPTSKLCTSASTGIVEGGSCRILSISPTPNACFIGGWDGCVEVHCNGRTTTVGVHVDEGVDLGPSTTYEEPKEPLHRRPRQVQPISGGNYEHSDDSSGVEVSSRNIHFSPAAPSRTSHTAVTIVNKGPRAVTWALTPVAPPRRRSPNEREDPNEKDLFDLNSKVFYPSETQGSLSPGENAALAFTFSPVKRGDYTQYYHLLINGDGLERRQLELLGICCLPSQHGSPERPQPKSSPARRSPAQKTTTPCMIEGSKPSCNSALPQNDVLRPLSQNEGFNEKRIRASPNRSKIVGSSAREKKSASVKSYERCVYVKETSVHFPLTMVGNTRTRRVRICNGSYADVRVKVAFPTEPSPFFCTHSSFVIKARSYVQLPVTFKPLVAGRRTESFAIFSKNSTTEEPFMTCMVNLCGDASSVPAHLSKHTVHFPENRSVQTITISNLTSKPLEWTVRCTDKRFCIPLTGSVAPESSVDVPLQYVEDNLVFENVVGDNCDISTDAHFDFEHATHTVHLHAIRVESAGN